VGDVGEPQLPPPHPDPLHPQGAERAKKALAIQDLRIPLRLQGREGLGGCRRLDPVSKFPVVNHRLTYPSVAPVEPAMAPQPGGSRCDGLDIAQAAVELFPLEQVR
jgi:hypothetical protein